MRYANYKQLASYIFILGMLLLSANQANAQIKDWNAGNGHWSNPANWAPGAVPQLGDLVRIGSIPGVQNNHVTLDADQVLFGLQLTDGMRLDTTTGLLAISGETLISGMNGPSTRSTLLINGAGGGGYDLITNQMSVENGGLVNLPSGGQLSVNDTLHVDEQSLLATGGGQPGIIDLHKNGGTAMSVDGTISSTNSIVINQLGTGLVDLDGDGSGQIRLSTFFHPAGRFAIHGTGLTDPYSGSIEMKSDSLLFMNLSDGWVLDGSIYSTSVDSDEFARVFGGDLELNGSITVASDSSQVARLRVEAVTTYQPSAQVVVGVADQLVQSGSADINGGDFYLAEDGQLDFLSPTSLGGGALFSTFSNDINDGYVNFVGATNWTGAVTINGIAMQNGESTVSGASTIDAGILDMDGSNGSTHWNINHTLVVNASGISSNGNNTFTGVLNIGTSAFSQFSINLDQEDSFWTMAGELNIANNFPFQHTRVRGSRMRLTGDLNVDGADVRVLADTDFANGNTTTFATPDTSLVMRGNTIVESAALFLNEGELINGIGGTLQLNGGASLNELRLLNRGILEVGDATGIADVAEFEATSNAQWIVELGGHVAGDEFDVLHIGNGNADLAGSLSVKLIDSGNGPFEPQIGDEFTVLSAVGDVSGQFANSPISVANGNGYLWEVLYNSHNVTLRLSDIVPDVLLGDINEDGNVDLLDVAPFVGALESGIYNVRADINCDGVVDLLDVSLFVTLLAS